MKKLNLNFEGNMKVEPESPEGNSNKVTDVSKPKFLNHNAPTIPSSLSFNKLSELFFYKYSPLVTHSTYTHPQASYFIIQTTFHRNLSKPANQKISPPLK
jgi:hypothetical protein